MNDPPVAAPDSATVDEDSSVIIDVLANDSDPDGDPISVTGATSAEGDVEVLEDGTLEFTPNPNFNGVATITYTLDDGTVTSNGTVTVTVNPVNDAPDTTAPDAPGVVANEADGITSIDLNPRVSDIDIGDTLTILSARLVDTSSGSPLPINVSLAAGVATFDPEDFGLDTGEFENVQLEYIVSDGSGASNATSIGYVDVTVNGLDEPPIPNNAPTAGAIDLTGGPNLDEADGVFTIDLAPVTDDPDGDTLTVVALFDESDAEVQFTQVGETIEIDPTQFGLSILETEMIVLTYTVDDGSGAANSQASSTITFTLDGALPPPPPPPPTPDNTQPVGADLALTVNEADGPVVIDLAPLVSDADVGDVLSITSVSYIPIDDSQGGEFFDFFSLDGFELTIDPEFFELDTGEAGTFQFIYSVMDDSGEANASGQGTISLTVNGEDEPITPAALDFEPFEDSIGNSVDITGVDYEGFTFGGIATVIETDELGGGGRGGGGLPGLTNGQTTVGGSNVVLGTASYNTVITPPVPPARDPTITTELNSVFSMYGPGVSLAIGESQILGNFLTSAPPDVSDQFGAGFNLDSLSLTAADGGTTAVTMTTYRIEAVADNPAASFSLYTAELVAVDSFVFNVDSSDATLLDFNALTADGVGFAGDAASFDGIYAVGFTSEDAGTTVEFDGVGIVLDDINVNIL